MAERELVANRFGVQVIEFELRQARSALQPPTWPENGTQLPIYSPIPRGMVLKVVQESEWSIGEVARRSGLKRSAIRYYEQIGLLPPARRVNGRRVYGPDTVRTLAVIETGQRAGLTLDEIGALLSASPGDRDATGRLRDLAARKLPEITALIARTEVVRGWLESAARCECPSLDECPLFEPALLPQKVPGF